MEHLGDRRLRKVPPPPVNLTPRVLGRGMWLAKRRRYGRVSALGTAQHARALGRGAGSRSQPRLPSEGAARGRAGASAGRGGPTDRRAATRGAWVKERRAGV